MPKLLITDDAAIIREMIKEAAAQAGWEVVGEATNGLEALEKYKELKPDLMTLDMVMPKHDGMYAIREIMQYDPSAKIIVVSAVDQANILKRAVALGITDFIVKPFRHGGMVETLSKQLPQAV